MTPDIRIVRAKSDKIEIYRAALVYWGPLKKSVSTNSRVINEVVLGTPVNKALAGVAHTKKKPEPPCRGLRLRCAHRDIGAAAHVQGSSKMQAYRFPGLRITVQFDVAAGSQLLYRSQHQDAEALQPVGLFLQSLCGGVQI